MFWGKLLGLNFLVAYTTTTRVHTLVLIRLQSTCECEGL